jgi:hypothetical protein
MATQKPRTTTEALKKRASAEYKRAHAQVLASLNDPIAAHYDRVDAAKLDAEAQAALATPEPLPVVRGGGEAILTRYPDQADDRVADWFVDTLQTPDLVKATASLERLRLLMDVGCVELAQDAAETIQPQNSLERMLAGQLTAAHYVAMKFLAKSETQMNNTPSWSQQADMMETCRLATTAARFMTVFQEGLQTLAKLRTGGKQVVVVQHVYVSEGGQAVVAGDLSTGGPSAVGGVCKNGGTIPCTELSTPLGRPRAVGRKRGKGRRVKRQHAEADDAVESTAVRTPEPREATSML